jgi:hypothetical protein
LNCALLKGNQASIEAQRFLIGGKQMENLTQAAINVSEQQGIATNVLGSLCWWQVEDKKVTYDRLLNAIQTCNLPTKYMPRKIDNSRAFRRALREIEKQSNAGERFKGIVITKIADNEARAVYAIHVREVDKENEAAYVNFEDQIDFNKLTGTVNYGSKYADQIEELLKDCLNFYTAANVRTIVGQLIKDWVQAVPARERGAVYFVRRDQFENLETIRKFIQMTTGGDIMDFPVFEAKRQEVWKITASELMAEYLEIRQSALEAMTNANFSCKIKNRMTELKEFEDKMMLYADLLQEDVSGIRNQIKETSDQLDKVLISMM